MNFYLNGRIGAVTLGLIFSSTLFAQTSIKLDEFLQLVESSHPAFERESLAPQILATSRDAYLGGQDMTFSVSPSFISQSPLATSTFTPTKITQTAFGTSVERAFWKTGGRLSAGWTSDFTDQDLNSIFFPGLSEPITTGQPKFYQNSLALTYTQPLMQNFKGGLDRLGYEVSQFAVDIAEIQVIENQEAFLLDMALKFIDWVVLTEQKKIAQGRFALLQRQLEQVEDKREANLVDRVDVLRSQDAVRMTEQGVVLVEAQWLAKQAELAVLSSTPGLYDRTPEFDLYERVERTSADVYLGLLKSQSRPLHILGLRGEMIARQQEGLEEMTKPKLFLTTQLSIKSGDDEFGGSFGMNKRDAGLFLQYQYPLGNRKALAEVRKNKLELRQAALDQADLALTLEATLRNLLIQVEQMEQVLSLNVRQIHTAKLRTGAELERYNQGRGDLTFVIQAQDNEESAALAYAQNAANYHRISMQLLSLIDEFKVSPDGLMD